MTVAMLRISDSTEALRAALRWFKNTGMAIAARIPMITTTTRSSIRVNPASRSSLFFIMRVSM